MSPGGHAQASGEVCCKKRGDELELVNKIHELAVGHGRYGYRRVKVLLRWEDWKTNRKRVHRIWKAEGLSLPGDIMRITS